MNLWQSAGYEVVNGIGENGLAKVVFSTLSSKANVLRRGWLRQPSGKKRLSRVSHFRGGGDTGLCRQEAFLWDTTLGETVLKVGDLGRSLKVEPMLRVRDKSFLLGICAGTDVVPPSNHLVGYKVIQTCSLRICCCNSLGTNS